MKNTPSEPYLGPRMPKAVQLRRVRHVIEAELSEKQRQVLLEVYLNKRTITQIAREQGVHPSTVCRTLHRAERNVRRFLRY